MKLLLLYFVNQFGTNTMKVMLSYQRLASKNKKQYTNFVCPLSAITRALTIININQYTPKISTTTTSAKKLYKFTLTQKQINQIIITRVRQTNKTGNIRLYKLFHQAKSVLMSGTMRSDLVRQGPNWLNICFHQTCGSPYS